jgi:hypothetical protein
VTKNNGIVATFPRSENITISENIVSGMTTWEGIDTHGGRAIRFVNNTITDCMIGIAVTRYDDGTTFLGPENCVVEGNTIRRESLAATAIRNAVQVVGPTSSEANWSTGNIVAGNSISGYGQSDAAFGSPSGAAIYCQAYRDVAIVNNVIVDSGVHAIVLDYMGGGLNIKSNTIRDLTGSSGSAFYFEHDGGMVPSGQVAENVIDVDGFTAFYLVNSMSGVDLINNDIVAADTHYDQTGGTVPLQYAGNCRGVAAGIEVWDPASIADGASASQAFTGIPGVSAISTITIAVNRDLQGMTIQALSAATDTNVGQFTVFLYNSTGGAINLLSLNIRYEVSQYR